MIVYHVVTDRPMYVGQSIVFDEDHHSGVYSRVMEKLPIVNEIYAHPEDHDYRELEHHTSVALRELALEEVRQAKYPEYPSRMACLYVSKTIEEAEKWADLFSDLGRPTYSIVSLEVNGRCFTGDATNCFDGRTDKTENLKLAEKYWSVDQDGEYKIREMLIDGDIRVKEIIRQINRNIQDR